MKEEVEAGEEEEEADEEEEEEEGEDADHPPKGPILDRQPPKGHSTQICEICSEEDVPDPPTCASRQDASRESEHEQPL